jgi:hypothetical protein
VSRLLDSAQRAVNAAAAHPAAMPATIAFVIGWNLAIFASGGKFDGNYGLINLLVNLSGLVFSLAACALAKAAGDHGDTHDKIDALHDRFDRLHAHIDGTPPNRAAG